MRNIAVSASMALALATPLASAEDADKPSLILSRSLGKEASDWENYLADTASAPIAAAGMLGISGDSIKPIENVRDLAVALKGFSTGDSKATLALSITPARTSIIPMSLPTYATGIPARALGSLTFGYAQGDATISNANFERRAYSAETNVFFKDEDDPILAYALALAGDKRSKTKCQPILQASVPEDSTPTSASSSTRADRPAAERPREDTKEALEAAKARAKECRDKVVKGLKWNRSQASIHYASGRIKAKDGGREVSLGTAFAAGVTIGIGDKVAILGTYRRTKDEPVLESLTASEVVKKDTSLAVLQLSGGSEKMRFFAEGSNAKTTQVTASQRAFKRALGLDVRVFEATWLNLRVGRLAKIDGSGTETGSLFSLSYSPTALLK